MKKFQCFKNVILLMPVIFLFLPDTAIYAHENKFIWTQEDGHASNEVLNILSMSGVAVSREQTLYEKPHFYNGDMPLKIISRNIIIPGKIYNFTIAICHDFVGWRNVFLYLNEESALRSIPDGSYTIETKSGHILAETKLLYITKGAWLEIEEFHYGMDGKLIFKCKSKMDLFTGAKIAETEVTGKKVRDYYFIYPAPHR